MRAGLRGENISVVLVRTLSNPPRVVVVSPVTRKRRIASGQEPTDRASGGPIGSGGGRSSSLRF
jgi:hypothetical protein